MATHSHGPPRENVTDPAVRQSKCLTGWSVTMSVCFAYHRGCVQGNYCNCSLPFTRTKCHRESDDASVSLPRVKYPDEFNKASV